VRFAEIFQGASLASAQQGQKPSIQLEALELDASRSYSTSVTLLILVLLGSNALKTAMGNKSVSVK